MILINQQIAPYPYKPIVFRFLKVFNLWSWILALFGLAAAYLNCPSKALAYVNEAVYPFYIIHQTIIIILGYYLKDLDWGFWHKFSIMVIATFCLTWIIYEFFIRRCNFMRLLFGLKIKRKVDSYLK
ncbi:MAG: acyltransferase family protein [Odoribacter sp.]|nr:acyltransferase family protein [Odoribacter sp.]